MLAYSLYAFFSGFALFLLGLSVFMYFEGRKFGDNQFTVKLLPPPAQREAVRLAAEALAITDFMAEADRPSPQPAAGRTSHKTAEQPFSKAA